MAARLNPAHDQRTRDKIQTSQLINRLQDNALGVLPAELTQGQIKSIEILLKKRLPDLAQLQSRVNALQAVITGLEDELRSSTVVIKDLADQNALLIERVERARRALRRVVIAGTVWLALLSMVMLSFWTRH